MPSVVYKMRENSKLTNYFRASWILCHVAYYTVLITVQKNGPDMKRTEIITATNNIILNQVQAPNQEAAGNETLIIIVVDNRENNKSLVASDHAPGMCPDHLIAMTCLVNCLFYTTCGTGCAEAGGSVYVYAGKTE